MNTLLLLAQCSSAGGCGSILGALFVIFLVIGVLFGPLYLALRTAQIVYKSCNEEGCNNCNDGDSDGSENS